MKKFSRQSGWTPYAALSVFAFCVAVSVTNAQTTGYSTGFDGTDIVNGVNTTANYSTAFNAQGTAPLAGQNGWASNDSAAGTAVSPTPASGYQTNGGTTTVGAFGVYTGNSAAIGGLYRNPGNTTDATSPDVIPSTASGGTVNLFRSVAAGAPQYVFDVDFDITRSTSTAAAHDSFSFTLRNTANAALVGTPLVAINFVPSTTPADPTRDAITYQANNGAAVSTTQGITIDPATLYHLTITVTGGANPKFTAAIRALATGSPSINLTPITGVALTSSNVNQFSADWSLADKTTITNGGYTGAGTNALEFDNVTVLIPEPSTYAMVALGLVGLVGTWRLRRQRA